MNGKTRLKKHNKIRCNYGPVNTFTVDSPIGKMMIVSCPKGLHSVSQEPCIDDSTFSPEPRCEVKLTKQQWEDNGYTYKPAVKCIEWLKTYFNNPHDTTSCERPDLCPTLLPTSGLYRCQVWDTLSKCVPPGDTISYGKLAEKVDPSRWKASQAVGTAMKCNPVQLIVPCHRVIRYDGSIGQYSGGAKNKVKDWLLKHEGNDSR